MKIDRIYGIDADDKFLWGVRWSFNEPSELVKIDLAKAIIVKENQLSEIGKVKDPNGKNIPQSIKPHFVTALDNLVWIGGLTSAGAYQREAIVQASLPSGKPASDPIFFRYVPDPAFFQSRLPGQRWKTCLGSRLWVAYNENRPYQLYTIDPKNGDILAMYPLDSNVAAMTAENGSLFIILVNDSHYTLWTVK